MIKINLLPVRAARKKETAKQQLVILLVSVLGVVVLGLGLYFFISLKIDSTKKEIANSEQKLQELKAKIGKINDLKKLQEEVKKKLDVLLVLRKEKTGPVRRFLVLSESTPDKLWITKYAETGADVALAGVAFNEELIASFMRSLDASPDYENVELVVSEQADLKGIKTKKFDLKMKLTPKTADSNKPVQR